MGCVPSKGKVCRSCKSPYSPVRRRRSSKHVQNPPQKTGDSHHMAALTSSTLGSLDLDPSIQENIDLSTGLIEAKNCSKMVDEKIPKVIPKTPIRTPPGEPEIINTWEMMEGLEMPPNSNLTWDSKDKKKPSLETDEKNVDDVFSDKLIVYFTSLRGVRKTYEDCCHVRVILKGLGVKVDERDVSMHLQFKEELKELLGEAFGGGGGGGGLPRVFLGMTCGGGGLPRVFLGMKCIGGAEEIRRLNEEGKLEKIVENCEKVANGGGGDCGNSVVCEACGDIRFVPCETCWGSSKIYYEEDYGEEDENDYEYGFQKCPYCNENGLIRCPICCD